MSSSNEMIIYVFLLGFFSSYDQNIWHQKQNHLFKEYKQLNTIKYYIAQTSKKKKKDSSKLNKVHSHEMQISLTNLNYTLRGVQIQPKKKKIVFFKKFYDQKQNAHIILNEQMQK